MIPSWLQIALCSNPLTRSWCLAPSGNPLDFAKNLEPGDYAVFSAKSDYDFRDRLQSYNVGSVTVIPWRVIRRGNETVTYIQITRDLDDAPDTPQFVFSLGALAVIAGLAIVAGGVAYANIYRIERVVATPGGVFLSGALLLGSAAILIRTLK